MYCCCLTSFCPYKWRTLQPSQPVNRQWQPIYKMRSSQQVI
nr:MAG TPA: hypothetical protein [Caudoviricetes sp.]